MPALNSAELDRLQERLTLEEERSLLEATKELLPDVVFLVQRKEEASSGEVPVRVLPQPLRVLGYSTTGEAGAVALQAFGQILDDLPIILEVGSNLLASGLVTWMREQSISVVCIADLPPNGDSRVRTLVKRLRAAAPELRIMVGRWASPSLADENTEQLTAAGASHVSSTLEASRVYLQKIVALLSKAELESPPTSVEPKRIRLANAK
ncbi:MAG: hypothetical protein JNM84_01260 [Planctomycetes bacterium]|nr:hypothetical protein [Planctomycetota bacterium]